MCVCDVCVCMLVHWLHVNCTCVYVICMHVCVCVCVHDLHACVCVPWKCVICASACECLHMCVYMQTKKVTAHTLQGDHFYAASKKKSACRSGRRTTTFASTSYY